MHLLIVAVGGRSRAVRSLFVARYSVGYKPKRFFCLAGMEFIEFAKAFAQLITFAKGLATSVNR